MIAETLEELTLPIDVPKLFPGNARRGDHEKIKRSLLDHRQYKPIVLNKRRATKYGDNTTLAGNQTLICSREIGMTEIDVWYVDVDDDEALEINLVDNATSDSAYNDPALLAALLQEARSTERAGYDDDFLAGLQADMNLDLGGIDVGEDSYKEQYGVIVICDGEMHQEQVFERLQADGYSVRVVVT